MKVLALEEETPNRKADDFQPYLKAEAERVWELYRAGIIRELYFNQDTHTAVLVLECADMAEAGATLATLPLVQAGLIAFQLIPLIPYDGFARLFAQP